MTRSPDACLEMRCGASGIAPTWSGAHRDLAQIAYVTTYQRNPAITKVRNTHGL